MYNFCVFAGTTEGRELVEYLTDRADAPAVTACVATAYGETLLPAAETLTVRAGAMTEAEMAALFSEQSFDLVVDATHPYAAAVTENLRRACGETGTPYLRLLRPGSSLPPGAVCVPDAAAAAEVLNAGTGNILLTTGSKTLGAFGAVRGFAERVYARVLPTEASLAACRAAGLPPAHILAMQGPFSAELNTALLRAVNAAFLVTKDGGAAGGFPEKAEAAARTGARLVVLGRPDQGGDPEALDLPGTLALLRERCGLAPPPPAVTVLGLGPGARESMTLAAREAAAAADCLLGARRAIDALRAPGQCAVAAIDPAEIAACIDAHPEFRRFAVVMSGDSGFYSGTKRLLPLLARCRVTVLPGISALSCLCARLGVSYEDVTPVSLHGRTGGVVPAVRAHRRVFVLTGGPTGINDLCRTLCEAGLGDVRMHVGQRLSYPEERIDSGTPAALAAGTYDSLSAALIENDSPDWVLTPGLPDGAFLRREGVPMTKSEVRAVCLSKLRLTPGAVCWDVGAGTGSVSVELARTVRDGRVYAVERDEAAAELLGENARRFGLDNLVPVPGAAPAACRDLPAPTHAFLGGSGGALRDVIALLLEKNPRVRIVAAAVTLESVAALSACRRDFPFRETEAVCLTVARDRQAGSYHLMAGQNPVYLFTLQG